MLPIPTKIILNIQAEKINVVSIESDGALYPSFIIQLTNPPPERQIIDEVMQRIVHIPSLQDKIIIFDYIENEQAMYFLIQGNSADLKPALLKFIADCKYVISNEKVKMLARQLAKINVLNNNGQNSGGVSIRVDDVDRNDVLKYFQNGVENEKFKIAGAYLDENDSIYLSPMMGNSKEERNKNKLELENTVTTIIKNSDCLISMIDLPVAPLSLSTPEILTIPATPRLENENDLAAYLPEISSEELAEFKQELNDIELKNIANDELPHIFTETATIPIPITIPTPPPIAVMQKKLITPPPIIFISETFPSPRTTTTTAIVTTTAKSSTSTSDLLTSVQRKKKTSSANKEIIIPKKMASDLSFLEKNTGILLKTKFLSIDKQLLFTISENDSKTCLAINHLKQYIKIATIRGTIENKYHTFSFTPTEKGENILKKIKEATPASISYAVPTLIAMIVLEALIRRILKKSGPGDDKLLEINENNFIFPVRENACSRALTAAIDNFFVGKIDLSQRTAVNPKISLVVDEQYLKDPNEFKEKLFAELEQSLNVSRNRSEKRKRESENDNNKNNENNNNEIKLPAESTTAPATINNANYVETPPIWTSNSPATLYQLQQSSELDLAISKKKNQKIMPPP